MKDKKQAQIGLICGCEVEISSISYGFIHTCNKHKNSNIYDILRPARLILRSDNTNMLEQLAELEHKQWAYWTQYMLLHLSGANKLKWFNQIRIGYKDLTDKQIRYWEAKAKSIKPVLRQNPEAIVKIAKEFNEFVEKG